VWRVKKREHLERPLKMEPTQGIDEHIAITGSSGFLPTLLLKRLAELPSVKEVHLFDIRTPEITSSKFIFHRMDITKEDTSSEMAQILIDNKITTFIHAALFSGPTRKRGQHRETESIGTFHVLNAVAESKIKRLIVHSATFVYGAYAKNPNFIHETQSLRSVGSYFVKTRVEVEQQIQEFADSYKSCDVIVLRFAPILGPNSNNIRARYFLSGVVPKVLGYDPLLQFIHEEDALRASLMALSCRTRGIFNIVGRGIIPLSTGLHLAGRFPLPFVSHVCRSVFSMGYMLRIWDLPQEMVPFFQFLCVADCKKAERELGFTAQYSSRQALKSMIEASRLRNEGFTATTPILGEDRETSQEAVGFRRVY